MSTPETQEPNSIYSNLDSDAFLKGTSVNSRLSLLGKELYDNIENLILDENSLGNYFKKRNLDKKTIYSSNKLKLDLDELNSDSTSVENVLIEEKYKEILFKGTDEEQNEEGETQETPETPGETKVKKEKETNDDLFDTLEQDIENKIQKKCGMNKNDDNENDNGNNINENNDEIKKEDNPNVNENDNDYKKMTSTLVQDISDYNQEFNENKEMNNIFDMLSDVEENKKENKENIEEKEKLEKIGRASCRERVSSPV